MGAKNFYYWRELLFMALMITVLLIDFALFDVLSPFGDEGAVTGNAPLMVR